MSIFTIIAGVNGVGKSSLTGLLKGERSDLGFMLSRLNAAEISKAVKKLYRL